MPVSKAETDQKLVSVSHESEISSQSDMTGEDSYISAIPNLNPEDETPIHQRFNKTFLARRRQLKHVNQNFTIRCNEKS